MRSYQGYYTRSHQNSEVKRLWAGIVLGWVTSREVPVLHPLLFLLLIYYLCIFTWHGGQVGKRGGFFFKKIKNELTIIRGVPRGLDQGLGFRV